MIRLLRMMKMKNYKGKWLYLVNEFMRIGVAFERIAVFGLVFFLMCHVIACFWVFLAKYSFYEPESWVARGGY